MTANWAQQGLARTSGRGSSGKKTEKASAIPLMTLYSSQSPDDMSMVPFSKSIVVRSLLGPVIATWVSKGFFVGPGVMVLEGVVAQRCDQLDSRQ